MEARPYRRLRHRLGRGRLLALFLGGALLAASAAGIIGGVPAAAQTFNITPQDGPYTGGTPITVTDNGAGDFGCASAGGCFGEPQRMLFGTQAVPLTVVNANEVQATAPPGCGTVSVWAEGTTVGGSGDYDNSYLVGNFTYDDSPPTITGISPAGGTANGGTIVTITGTNLAGVKEVWFGQPLSYDHAQVLSDSATAVSVLTPSGLGPEAVNVSNGVCSSQNSTVKFDFVSPPWVSSVTPSGGPSTGGTPVTLQGAYFTGATAVDFGTNPASSVTVSGDAYLTAVSPPGAGTVDVTVYNPVAGWSPANSFDKFTYACGSGAVGPVGGAVGSCDGQGTLQIPPGALSGPANVTLTPADLAALAQAANNPATSATAQQLLQWFQKATAAGATSITVNSQQIPVPSDWQDLPAFLEKLYAALGVPSNVNDRLTGFQQAVMDIGSGSGTAADLENMQAAGDWLTSNLGLPPSTVDPQGTLAYLANADRDAFLFGTPPKYTNSQDPWYEAWLAAQSYAASNGCYQNCIDATFYGPGLDGSLTTNPASVTCQGVQCYDQAVQYDLQRVQWIMDTPGTGCLVNPATCGGDPPPGDPPSVLQGLGTVILPLLAAPNLLPPLGEGMQVDLGGASLSEPATLTVAYKPSSVPAGDAARVYSFVYTPSVAGSVYAFTPLATTLANDQAAASISAAGDYGVLPAPNPAPQVTGLGPTTGSAGDTVSVTGSGFTGATAVDFGTSAAVSFTVESGNALTAVAPAGTGAVFVTVTTPQGTSLPDALSVFTYAAASASGGGGGGGAAAPPAPYPSGGASVQVGSAGGTVAAADGGLSLQVPSGAFSTAVQVVVSPLSANQAPAPPAGFSAAAAWSIDAGGVEPKAPVTASFKYDPAVLEGRNPARLGVYVYHPQTGRWTWVGGVVNPTTDTITVTLTHLSTYAVLANTTTFTDLGRAEWARGAVDTLLGADVVAGMAPGVFGPDSGVTRAQFVTMLVKAERLTPAASGQTPFSDVPSGQWYAPYVAAAYQAGLVAGMGGGSFDPNGQLTRAQLAVLVAKATGASATTSLSRFSDAAGIPPWAKAGVETAVAKGLLAGFPGGTFGPDQTATRAQAAAVLAAYLRQQGKA
ncbi:MAG: S-layer homology domain-containing protein [Thermaerobacter sp.]|nr:S-layer homology domain-containing protein [Thermaerobacter sp.]